MEKEYFDNMYFKDANEKIYVKDSEARGEIEILNSEINGLIKKINDVNSDLTNYKKYSDSNDTILIGDSYAVKSVVGNTTWQDVFEQCTGFNCHKYSQGSIGFIGITTNTFLTFLNRAIAEITDKKAIRNIVVCGGCNDIDKDSDLLLSAIGTFVQTAKTNFVNAKIYIGCIGNFKNSYNNHEKIFIAKNIYKRCVDYGAIYLTGVSFPMTDNGNFLSDGVHPSVHACKEIGEAVVQSLKHGAYSAYKYRSPTITPAGVVTSFSGGNAFKVQQFSNNFIATTYIVGQYNIGTGIHLTLNTTKTITGNDQFVIGTIDDSLMMGSDGAQSCCSMYARLMDANPYPIAVYPCIISVVNNKIYLKIINNASSAAFSVPIQNVSRIDLLYNGCITVPNF